ncbi:unknown [Sutterella sp. CAG:351]|nr:unknown [Sutterella sp. CAG:351]
MIAAPGTTIAGTWVSGRTSAFTRWSEHLVYVITAPNPITVTIVGTRPPFTSCFTKASTAAPTVVGDPSATCPISAIRTPESVRTRRAS